MKVIMRTPRNKLTDEQKRVLDQNPHLQSGKLAKFLGLSVNTVTGYRGRNGGIKWSYSGVGIPFVRFDKWQHCSRWRVRYKMKLLFSGSFDNAIKVQGQLIWMLENGLNPFEEKRIRKPVKTILDPFAGLKFGGK
jgi:hypothetical protein